MCIDTEETESGSKLVIDRRSSRKGEQEDCISAQKESIRQNKLIIDGRASRKKEDNDCVSTQKERNQLFSSTISSKLNEHSIPQQTNGISEEESVSHLFEILHSTTVESIARQWRKRKSRRSNS